MNAISGTRRAMKELVDGTIRVCIDISPVDSAAFHKLFPSIDMPVALAPLIVGAMPELDPPKHGTVIDVTGEGDPSKIGPLCLLACKWCDDKEFLNYLLNADLHAKVITPPILISDPVLPDEYAKKTILFTCGIKSRKELDTNPEAAERFHKYIRIPYAAYLTERAT